MASYEVFQSDRVTEARSVSYGVFDNPYYARFAIPTGVEGQAYTVNEAGELVHYAYSYEEVYFHEDFPNSRQVNCGWTLANGERQHTYDRFEHRTVKNPNEWHFQMATGSRFGRVEDPF